MDTLTLSLDLIDPPLVQERALLHTPAFEDLVTDIRVRGLLQPIVVRPVDGRYRVVAGYRRTEAARQAGLLEVPAVVRELDDADELSARCAENAHRENPNPVEEGALFAAMQEGLGFTAAAIAQRVTRSPAYVAARLELVRGPAPVRDAVQDGRITFSVAHELLRCDHPADQAHLLHHAMAGGCTAALMRGWVTDAARRRALQPAGADPRAAVVSPTAPPILTAICDWHEQPVPLDGVLSFRVCTICYQALLQLREHMKAQDASPPEEGSHAPGGDPHVQPA